ncbi:MAG: hypothetical protein ING52_10710 [Burkholderiales bacterium]|jgi:hypothetical protein|nr:hypothetical protein [Burkholderiales bacterium]
MSTPPRFARCDLSDEPIEQILCTPIPGGSQARAWFLPHADDLGSKSARNVVRQERPCAPPATQGGLG